MVRSRLLPLVLVATLVAGACSDGDGDEAAATTVPSDAEPTLVDGRAEAPDPDISEEAVTVTTPDGQQLAGQLFVPAGGTGGAGVVLGHMRGTGKETWFDFARVAAANGFTTLAIDFRGYGDSTGDRDTSLDVDLTAAVAELRDRGVADVSVAGASMGATAAVAVAAELDLEAVVSLSGPGRFAGIDAVGAAPSVDERAVFVVASGDLPFVGPAEDMATASGGELVVYDGASHGTNLFDDHGTELTALLLATLRG